MIVSSPLGPESGLFLCHFVLDLVPHSIQDNPQHDLASVRNQRNRTIVRAHCGVSLLEDRDEGRQNPVGRPFSGLPNIHNDSVQRTGHGFLAEFQHFC